MAVFSTLNLRRKSVVIVFPLTVGIYFIKQYMSGGVCTSAERLDGKIVIVTGANTGIGKQTVKGLAQRGAKVYLACRSVERAQAAVDDIVRATGVDASQLPVIQVELGSLQSIRDFADTFKKKEKQLDILVNNAGVMWLPQGTTTNDGFEPTFGINYLGHFLLTHLLIDVMLSSNAPSRIVNVSSIAYKSGQINFDDLMMKKTWNQWASYCQSKLANVMFTRELARRLKGTRVTAYSLHPGAVVTDIARNMAVMQNNHTIVRTFLMFVSWPFVKDPWSGAQTSIYCAVDKDLENQSGKYYSDCKERALVAGALDDDVAKRLWDVSVELVQLKPEEVHPLLR